jgi:transporter family protein
MWAKWEWILLALASAVFAGLTAILIKLGLTKEGDKEINSNLATLLRVVVIVPLAVLIVSLRGEWEPLNRLSRRGVFFLVLSAIATGLSWLCYNRAIDRGPVSVVAPLDKLSVALAMVLAWLFLGERMTWQGVVGGLLVVAGLIVLALPAVPR